MNCHICKSAEFVSHCERCHVLVCAAHAKDGDMWDRNGRRESWVCLDSCRALALVPVKFCMECRQPTTGSIGAAGYYWPRLCQPCKDSADGYLSGQVHAQAAVMTAIGSIAA